MHSDLNLNPSSGQLYPTIQSMAPILIALFENHCINPISLDDSYDYAMNIKSKQLSENGPNS